MTGGRVLDFLAPPLCTACQRNAGRTAPLCPGCRVGLRWLGSETVVAGGVELWAPVAYEGPARALVAAFKFRGAVGLAGALAAQIAATAPPGVLERTVLVPVPLHPARRRRRGYNQAELLAAALATRTGLGLSDCLRRAGAAGAQVGRGRLARARAIEGTVAVRPDAPLPARVLLVDDVVTTGATLEACAGALRAAGTGCLRAVAYARTPGR